MLTEDTLRAALRRAEIPPAVVRYEESVASTNTVALELAVGGAPEWSVVAAGHQTAGRGRLGRTWHSEPGAALQFSFVLRPDLVPSEAALLTLLAGAAMARGATDCGVAGVRCKWPNDLLVGEAKAGGILTEATVTGGHLEHVVVGIGVNLAGPPRAVEGAGALGDVEPGDLLGTFFAEFRRVYREVPPGELADEVVRLYRPLCATLGRRVRATTVAGETVEGLAVDLDPGGNLVVQEDGDRLTVRFGEVHHLR